MKRTAQCFLAFFMIVADRPPPMHAAVRECLDLVFGNPDDQEGKLGNIVDMGVADIHDVILVAGHLPYPFPELLHFAVMLFLGPVTADLDRGDAGFHR